MQLQSLSNIVKTIRELPREAALTITDNKRFIYYQPGETIDISIKPGEELKEGTVSLKTLQLKRIYSTEVDKQVFGKPYYATGYPIINGRDVEGVVTAIFPLHFRNQQNISPFLIGKMEDFWIPIPLKDIVFITAEEGKTFLHTKSGIYQNKYSLSEIEYRLPQDQFIRCHRSFIVRMDSISEIQPNFHSTFLLIMKDEKRTRIPVSQSFASYFRTLLGF